MPINYDLAKRESPRLKAELTRAQKKGYQAVLDAARHAVQSWEAWGAWSDNWHRWQIAIVDAANQHTRNTGDYVVAPRLEDLLRDHYKIAK